MRKGISIPIHTLVMLAIAVVVMLAVIAWFMGGFGRSGSQISAQQKFNTACTQWTNTNCRGAQYGQVPSNICQSYKNMTGDTTIDCSNKAEDIARQCGCNKPFGTGGETPTTVVTTTTIT